MSNQDPPRSDPRWVKTLDAGTTTLDVIGLAVNPQTWGFFLVVALACMALWPIALPLAIVLMVRDHRRGKGVSGPALLLGCSIVGIGLTAVVITWLVLTGAAIFGSIL